MKRRGSIVGPIIVILIGALFLANNLRPEVPLLEFLGRYWPFLLIGWGVVRLIEILFWAFTDRPLPRVGISGGEWFLVVILSLLGTGLYAFNSSGIGWPPARFRIHGVEMFGDTFDYGIDERRIPAQKTVRVVIENLRGNTRIVGSDVDEVRVVGRKSVRSMSRAQADQVNRVTNLDVSDQSSIITVKTNQERAPQERYVTADLEITVPRGASIQARGRYGDFDINDLQGGIDIDSDNAGVRLQSIGGNVRVNVRRSDVVRAHTVQGEVELRGRGNDIELENVAGQVTVEGSWGGEVRLRNVAKPVRYMGQQVEFHAQRVTGEVRMNRGSVEGESVTGPVVLRGHSKGCCDVKLSDFSSALELAVERGDIDLRPGMPVPKMNVDLRNGDIDLALPQAAKFSLRAKTNRGEVENEFSDALKTTGEEDRGAQIIGSIGEGPAITLTNDRGTITLRKAEDNMPQQAPLTPQPPSKPARPVSVQVN